MTFGLGATLKAKGNGRGNFEVRGGASAKMSKAVLSSSFTATDQLTASGLQLSKHGSLRFGGDGGLIKGASVLLTVDFLADSKSRHLAAQPGQDKPFVPPRFENGAAPFSLEGGFLNRERYAFSVFGKCGFRRDFPVALTGTRKWIPVGIELKMRECFCHLPP
jgi:hypothetical protein